MSIELSFLGAAGTVTGSKSRRSGSTVANLTRKDGEEFLAIAGGIPIRTTTATFPLERANEALSQLRAAPSTALPCWCLSRSIQP